MRETLRIDPGCFRPERIDAAPRTTMLLLVLVYSHLVSLTTLTKWNGGDFGDGKDAQIDHASVKHPVL